MDWMVELGARAWDPSLTCFMAMRTVVVFLVDASLLAKPKAGQLPV